MTTAKIPDKKDIGRSASTLLSPPDISTSVHSYRQVLMENSSLLCLVIKIDAGYCGRDLGLTRGK